MKLRSFYEFFSGAGMARAGLGFGWECLFANDIDPRKAATYRNNWPARDLHVADISQVTAEQIRGHADLAWASFPCQDLSLAGSKKGLGGTRSSTFWNFWKLMQQLHAQQRAPSIIAIENVYGAVTSHQGRDFARIIGAISELPYRVGALVVDAEDFVPQSRPRLFIIAAHDRIQPNQKLVSPMPIARWTPNALSRRSFFSENALSQWVWWNLAKPPLRQVQLSDLIDIESYDAVWHTQQETQRLLAMMSPANYAKVQSVVQSGQQQVGCVYRRTRATKDGTRQQRAEIRFDGIAGCLRTPGGGSSRQTVLFVSSHDIRSRLLTTREAARLMGLGEDFKLPNNYNEAYKVAGDGVVVPVVKHLTQYLFEPLLRARDLEKVDAA